MMQALVIPLQQDLQELQVLQDLPVPGRPQGGYLETVEETTKTKTQQ